MLRYVGPKTEHELQRVKLFRPRRIEWREVKCESTSPFGGFEMNGYILEGFFDHFMSISHSHAH